MKTQSACALLSTILSSFLPILTHACSCGSWPPTLQDALHSNTGSVFRGKIVKELNNSATSETDNADGDEKALFLVRVAFAYKGCPFSRGDDVVVTTAAQSSLCGIADDLDINEEYLFSGDVWGTEANLFGDEVVVFETMA